MPAAGSQQTHQKGHFLNTGPYGDRHKNANKEKTKFVNVIKKIRSIKHMQTSRSPENGRITKGLKPEKYPPLVSV